MQEHPPLSEKTPGNYVVGSISKTTMKTVNYANGHARLIAYAALFLATFPTYSHADYLAVMLADNNGFRNKSPMKVCEKRFADANATTTNVVGLFIKTQMVSGIAAQSCYAHSATTGEEVLLGGLNEYYICPDGGRIPNSGYPYTAEISTYYDGIHDGWNATPYGKYCALPGNTPPGVAKQSSCVASSEPIVFANGNKNLIQEDGFSFFKINRTFNSLNTNSIFSSFITGVHPTETSLKVPMPIGQGWMATYLQRLRVPDPGNTVAWAARPSGRIYTFNPVAGSWNSDADIADRLTELRDGSGTRIGWRYYAADTQETETYDAAGVLQSIALKDGTHQTLTYTDGTNGSASGKGGYVLDATGTATTTVLPVGLLLRVVDDFGHTLSFAYDAVLHITRISDGSSTAAYAYGTADNLSTVTYPGSITKTYLYGESAYILGTAAQPNVLTGVLDENGTRYITYWYDTNGRAYDEKLNGDVGRNRLTYTPDGSGKILNTVVTDALGASRRYTFTNFLGVNRLSKVDQPGGSGCGAAYSTITYDTNGNTASRTDFNNAKTCSSYELTRNLEGVRLEGLAGSTSCPSDLAAYSIPTPSAGASVSVRKVTTSWHPAWRLESRRAEPKLITTSVFNGQVDPTNVGAGAVTCAPVSATVTDITGAAIPIAVLCRRIEQATSDETGSLGFSATAVGSPRITNYTYNAFGQILSEDGPRTDVSDVTTYTYYSDTVFDGAGAGHTTGDLWKVTNALGGVTEYTSYDKAGRVLESKDANNVLTQSTYWPRGWLKSQGTVVGSVTQATLYDYDGVGQLKKVTQPDGSYTSYDYDAAHRLTDIRDSLNNSIHYTLDAAGNRSREDIKDPSGTLKHSTIRVFDQLGRLQNVVLSDGSLPLPPAVQINFALASNGVSLSSSGIYGPGYPVEAINDGLRQGSNWGNGGGWNSSGPSPAWVVIDFGQSRTINEIDVITQQDNYTAPIEPDPYMTFGMYGVTDFEAQVWNSTAGAWVTVPGGTITSNNLVWRKISFAPIQTSRIRILVHAALYYDYSRLIEVEAWGTP